MLIGLDYATLLAQVVKSVGDIQLSGNVHSTFNLSDPNFADFGFNGLDLQADNPSGHRTDVSVKVIH